MNITLIYSKNHKHYILPKGFIATKIKYSQEIQYPYTFVKRLQPIRLNKV